MVLSVQQFDTPARELSRLEGESNRLGDLGSRH
jgi:hypothetical protein